MAEPALDPAPQEDDDPLSARPGGDIIRDPLELVAALPRLLPGTNAVGHEAEIGFVVDHALRRGGVNTPAQFEAFIERQMVNLIRNGEVARNSGRFTDPEPVIKKLVRHLKTQQSIFPKG